ncbi:MAG: efflux RND transporter periplasmic adaptor subunit [Polyangiaceae bacterium]
MSRAANCYLRFWRQAPKMEWNGLALAIGLSLLGCNAASADDGPGAKPLPVHLLELQSRPVDEYNEYLASLTSRQSLDLYAQVSAYVSRVKVKPGSPVHEGDVLIDLDTGQQMANLRTLRANLATQRANLNYAVKNDQSSQALVAAGVLSRLDYQQRHAQREVAQADVHAGEAQVDAQARLLGFYRITAPSDGVVGDVPVKVGDYVTPQTLLTSVAQNAWVEVYVYVPVARVADIKPETRIVLLDQASCKVCERTPTFIAQQVDPNTQSVLVKTICPNSGHMRESEVLKARLIWSRHPGLLVPTTAVTRLAGQYFVFLATQGPHGLEAAQRPIQVGEIQGNDYVVKSGLSAGDKLVTSGVQKIRPGMPISPAPAGGPAGPGQAPRAATKSQCADLPAEAGAPADGAPAGHEPPSPEPAPAGH